jgi:hypothetical protein
VHSSRAALAIFGLAPLLAAAEADTEAVRLNYSADAACPSAPEFESAVTARLRRGRVAPTGELAREFRVVVTQKAPKHVARLEFVDAAGITIVREVAADQCAEAVRAIALVTALAIDAVVPEDPRPVSPSPTQTAPARGEPEQGSRIVPRPPRDARPAPPTERPPTSSAPRTAASPGPSAPFLPRFELGARATLTTPKAPNPLFGAELFGALESPGTEWLVHFGVAGERGTLVHTEPGDAQFSFLGGRLEGCASIRLGSSFRAMPCALLEAGAVVAEGFSDESRTVVDPWVATGPTARLAFDWGGGRAALEAGAIFPLTSQDDTVFGDIETPQVRVHSVPTVGAFVALGAALDLE